MEKKRNGGWIGICKKWEGWDSRHRPYTFHKNYLKTDRKKPRCPWIWWWLFKIIPILGETERSTTTTKPLLKMLCSEKWTVTRSSRRENTVKNRWGPLMNAWWRQERWYNSCDHCWCDQESKVNQKVNEKKPHVTSHINIYNIRSTRNCGNSPNLRTIQT